MDFIEGLPTSGFANCIMVVVDKFSKFAHFIPLHHPFTAAKVAQSFLDSVYRLHGMPTHIISDRDPIFTSQFWKELFRLAQVELCMSSAYHPQSDGQTQRVNQCLETYLGALSTLAHAVVSNGFRSLNTGTIPVNILLLAALHSSYFTVGFPVILVLLMSLLLLCRMWLPNWLSAIPCSLRCVNICSAPSSA
jgi:hypothetical protein